MANLGRLMITALIVLSSIVLIKGTLDRVCPAQDPPQSLREEIPRSIERILVPSLFPNLPPYIKFLSADDPPTALPRRLRKFLKWRGRNVPEKHLVRNIVENTGFTWLPTEFRGNWSGYWGSPSDLAELRRETLEAVPSNKWNHFIRSGELSNKDLMWINFRSTFKRDPLKNIPLTFNLPAEIKEFKSAFDEIENKLWIEKMALASRGRGMRIIENWSEIDTTSNDRRIVQKYIHNSYLVEGKKSEMRIHALVTSYEPLRLYMYRDVSLVIGYENFAYGPGHPCRLVPSKCGERVWNLAKFEEYVKEHNISVDMSRFWAQVDDITIKVVLGAAGKIAESSRKYFRSSYNAYELLGMDFAIDDQFVPYLLEVNTDPSMDTSSDAYEAVKMSHSLRDGLSVEALTVAGHHLPPYLDPETKEFIKTKLELDVDPTFPEHLYRLEESTESISKQKKFESPGSEAEDTTKNLSPEDLRHLIIAEEELSRTKKYERIFPSEGSWDYLKDLPHNGGYYNRLYADWEKTYGPNRGAGIQRLVREAKDLFH